MLKNKSLLITGGTGSFGTAMLNKLISSNIGEIKIFSRDELKQDIIRQTFSNDKIKFIVGDVRDYSAVFNATKDTDFIFHAAALKQVPSCEFYPIEAVKTNIIGTENLLSAAIENRVQKIVCLSTDKAVYPINAMGTSKAMMEKVAKAKSILSKDTKILITRYGNVMASRGSIIPLMINQIKKDLPITITDPDMTRFMMSLTDAIDLVLFAFENGNSGDILVHKSPSVTLDVLAKSIKKIMKKNEHEVKIIGTRHGEKKHETLITNEEMQTAEDLGDYYRIIPDLRDLNYNKIFKKGKLIKDHDEFNSKNVLNLDIEQMIQKLDSLDLVWEYLSLVTMDLSEKT